MKVTTMWYKNIAFSGQDVNFMTSKGTNKLCIFE